MEKKYIQKNKLNIRDIFTWIYIFVLLIFLQASPAFAVPETTSLKIADVTPSSFSVVWMT